MLETRELEVSKLTADNELLLSRLLTEKNKMIEQMNAMMEGLPKHTRGISADSTNGELAKNAEAKITADVRHLVAKGPRRGGTVVPSTLRHSIVCIFTLYVFMSPHY